ncbi:hypothetical protein [Variovorax sp. 3P27G3]|jgi:translation initiation factor 2B subunit (eIF-2B alpha/beta/delta family)|uniref:hypothetical protein n=1 Tax=Variovorax sp. 3P27G3 TaxID=2502214 RepID=UPI0010F5A513|nr:hypothetical protein [Variovorax sp. 3P27G3]
MTKPDARKQLSNVWQAAFEDLMAMSESEIDAELRELDLDPATAAQKGKKAIEDGISQARASHRAQLREKMASARDHAMAPRDQAVSVELARQRIAQMQAANDGRLTLAARNRDPKNMSEEEVLDLYWQIEELNR